MLTHDDVVNLRYKYADRFTHTDMEGDTEVTYRPQTVCNNKEIEEIFEVVTLTSNHTDVIINNILLTMRDRVGTSSKSPVVASRMKCAVCPEPLGFFRDGLSMQECSISGICQNCQDQLFKS